MQRTPFLAGLSQPYVRLGTLRGMSDVAKNLAIARKAVSEIRGIESVLLSSGANQEQMNAAMRDVADLAGAAAQAADEAVGLMVRMRAEVEKFISEADKEMTEVEDASG